MYLIIGYSKTFKFHLALPNNLPPSHEVPFGHTRYKLEAYYNSQTVYKYFSVNQWVGLNERNNNIVSICVYVYSNNLNNYLFNQVKREQFIVSCISFCRPIEVVLTLKQTYYLPGETVYVGIVTNNNSWKDVLFSKIFLIQVSFFKIVQISRY